MGLNSPPSSWVLCSGRSRWYQVLGVRRGSANRILPLLIRSPAIRAADWLSSLDLNREKSAPISFAAPARIPGESSSSGGRGRGGRQGDWRPAYVTDQGRAIFSLSPFSRPKIFYVGL